VVLVQSRETYGAIVNAVNVHDFQIDRDKASALSTELSKNNQRIAFLRDVAGALYSKEVAAVANGASASESGPSSDDEKTQVIRLVQTSITRFGTLIVVSFLVAILIPSYRYNVRLAAFYAARADALVAMRSRSLEHSQFELLTTVLTPHIEFGKSPSTPLEQVVDLVRAARGSAAGCARALRGFGGL
jgi:hypothetical protein